MAMFPFFSRHARSSGKKKMPAGAPAGIGAVSSSGPLRRQVAGWFITPLKRPRKWIYWCVGLYAAFCLLTGLALPYFLKGIVEEQMSKALRADCTIERLSFNPFTLTAGAHGIVIPYPDGKDVFLTLDHIELSPGFSTVLRLAPALGHLSVVNPSLHITLNEDGSVSLMQFVPPSEEPEQPAAAEGAGEIFPFIVSDMEVTGGKVDFYDRMHNATHTVRDLSISVPFTSSLQSDRETAMRPTLNATVDGRFFTLEGRTTPFAESLRTEFRMRFGELPLELFSPYLSTYTNLTLERGNLTAETVLHFRKRTGRPIDIGLSGALYISDLALSAPGEGTVFSLDYATLEMEHLLVNIGRISLAEMQLHNPTVIVAREKGGNFNWQRYLLPPKTKAPPKTAKGTGTATPQAGGASSARGTARNGTAQNATAAQPPAQNAIAGATASNAAPSGAAAQNATAAGNAPSRNATATPQTATRTTANATVGASAAQNAAATRLPVQNATTAKAAPRNATATGAATQNATAAQAQAQNATAGTSTRNATAAAAAAQNATSPPGATPPASAEAEAFFAIKKLSIVGGHVIWQDAAIKGSARQDFTPLGVEIRDFSTEGAGRGLFAFTVGEESVAAESLTEAFFQARQKADDAKAAPQTQPEGPAGNGTVAAPDGTAMPGSRNASSVPPANASVSGTPAAGLTPGRLNGTASDVGNAGGTVAPAVGEAPKQAPPPVTATANATTPQPEAATAAADGSPSANSAAAVGAMAPEPAKSAASSAPKTAASAKGAAKTATRTAPGKAAPAKSAASGKAAATKGTPAAAKTASANATAAASANATTAPANATDMLPANATASGSVPPTGNATSAPSGNATAATAAAPGTPPAVPAPVKKAPKPSPTGNFAVRGSLRLQPLAVELEVKSDALSLMHSAPYLQSAGVALKSALLEADARLTVRMEEKSPPFLALHTGTISLKNVSGSLPLAGGSCTARVGGLTVGDTVVDLSRNTITVGSLSIAAPDVQLALAGASSASGTGGGKADTQATAAGTAPDGGTPASAAKPSAAKTAGGAPVVSLKKVQIQQGQISVAATEKASPLVLSGLTLNAADISTLAGQSMSLTASTVWSKTGKLSLSGKGTLTPLNLELAPTLAALPLQSVAPWLRQVSVLQVAGGSVSGDLTVNVADAGIAVKAARTARPAGRQAARAQGAEEPRRSVLPEQQAVSSSDGIGIAVAGRVSVDDLSLREQSDEILGFKRLQVNGLRLNTAARTYDIAAISLSSPRMAFSLFNDGMNSVSRALDTTGEEARKAKIAMRKKGGPSALEKAVQEQEKAAEADGGAQADAKGGKEAPDKTASTPAGTSKGRTLVLEGIDRFTLGRFTMENGRARIRDERLPKRATISLTDLAVKAEGISTAQNSVASLSFTGKVEGAPLAMDAKLNPLYAPVEGQMTFSLDNMDLIPLSPYAQKYIAYPIEGGALSLGINVRSENGLIKADNKIVLGRLTLGDKISSPGAPNLPVKLGLSLLEDGNGVVSLTLPISGRVDDPAMRTGGIVMQAIANVLFKIVASPFSLVGSILGGGDGPSLQYIPFEAGDDRISAKSAASIQAVVDLLKKKQKITLILQGIADDGEKKALGPAFIRKGVQALKWDDLSKKEQAATLPADVPVGPSVNAEEYADLLFDFYADQPFEKPKTLGITKKQPVDVMEKMISEHVPATDPALDDLAQRRAEAVQAEVLRLAPELKGRVSVSSTPKIREAGEGAAPYSRVELGIK